LDAIQRLRRRIQAGGNDSQEELKEIEQFQQVVEPGPFTQHVEFRAFGKGSLFRRKLETLLGPRQMLAYKPIQEVIQAGGAVSTLKFGGDVFLSVRLTRTSFTDDGLTSVKSLPRLGSLDLGATKITDRGMVHIRELTELRELDLRGTKITDEGLPNLQNLS